MGTREVYEEKLKRGNLDYDPTIKPGLGSARCPRCLSLLNPTSKSGEWAITPVLHDVTAVAGSGIGGLLSAIHGFNTGIPFVQRHVKGPKWLPFVIGLPSSHIFCLPFPFGGFVCSFLHFSCSLQLVRHLEDMHFRSLLNLR
uniref:Uncharacterized protein LOC104225545 isoform X2 n=1 Tax=Nicotiana sylvestris TaxID=4096 RepID=A0A1U7WEJ8_NICSY|nr:PREDICTED: uncharacterized protein LOC104225545 isoform X2 [Nicotiana sylvestris]